MIAYECLKIIILGAATGAISMTISKSKLFKPLRDLIPRRNAFLAFLDDGLACPYCTSHWIAFLLTLVYFPKPLPHTWVGVDFLVSMMVIVALASFTAKWIFSIYADE
jgi:hypothetical protein